MFQNEMYRISLISFRGHYSFQLLQTADTIQGRKLLICMCMRVVVLYIEYRNGSQLAE